MSEDTKKRPRSPHIGFIVDEAERTLIENEARHMGITMSAVVKSIVIPALRKRQSERQTEFAT